MKKVLAILLAIAVLALSACAARQTAPDTQDTPAAETTGQPDASEQAGEEQASEEQQPAQEAKRVEKKEQKSEPESATFVDKTIQPVANKIFKKMSSTSYKRGVRKMSQERRDNDVAILNELIEQAQSLRDLIEAAK